MPIYEYLCKNCGHKLEEFQTMKEASLIKCPNCGKNSLKRLIGAGSGVIFKGSGFYATDYKKSKSSHTKAASKKEKKEHDLPAGTTETKPTETKKDKKQDTSQKK